MFRRSLAAAAFAAATLASPAAVSPALAQTEIQFWHAFQGPLGESMAETIQRFNDSQTRFRVAGTYKGNYAEILQSVAAAWRANAAPHIVQVYEVGTGTMLAAGPAVKPAWQLFQETGTAIDAKQYLPAVRGYYSFNDGRLASMPFNSSTNLLWFNRDAFAKAGLNPDAPPRTWPELVDTARKLKASGWDCVLTTSSIPWDLEQYSGIHNIPIATRGNGFDGLDAELAYNSPAHVKFLQRLLDMQAEGTFRFGGRDLVAFGPRAFTAGNCAMTFSSSASRADFQRAAAFSLGSTFLPFDPEVRAEPVNSLIGGASLWTMTARGRTEEEYRGVAAFFAFLSRPENDSWYHQRTGYVPITQGGYQASKEAGFYEKNPGTEIAILQLSRGELLEYSRGIRLGRFVEIRNILQEEVEKALQGQQGAQAAMDATVVRANRVLREFERASR